MSYPKIFHVYADACTGCRMCEIVCSLIKEKTGVNPGLSRIRISEDTEKGIYTPVVCQLCSDTPCLDACPESALSQDKKTGAIIVDEETCSACGLCIEACVHDAIFISPEKEVACVCDLCGGEPKCVKYCLQEAIAFRTPEKPGSVNAGRLSIKEGS